MSGREETQAIWSKERIRYLEAECEKQMRVIRRLNERLAIRSALEEAVRAIVQEEVG